MSYLHLEYSGLCDNLHLSVSCDQPFDDTNCKTESLKVSDPIFHAKTVTQSCPNSIHSTQHLQYLVLRLGMTKSNAVVFIYQGGRAAVNFCHGSKVKISLTFIVSI